MEENSVEYEWLYEKYHRKIKPWKLNCLELEMPKKGRIEAIDYSYCIFNDNLELEREERMPDRQLKI